MVIFLAGPGMSTLRLLTGLQSTYTGCRYRTPLKIALRFSDFLVRISSEKRQSTKPASASYKRKGNSVRILVIEDEPKLGRALQEGLQAEQHMVTVAHTGEEGFY